jgi:mRNA interferase MazF
MISSQVTSQFVKDNYAISIEVNDFEEGGLRQKSNVRPNRLFTADSHVVLYRIGSLKKEKMNEIIEKIIEIVRR